MNESSMKEEDIVVDDDNEEPMVLGNSTRTNNHESSLLSKLSYSFQSAMCLSSGGDDNGDDDDEQGNTAMTSEVSAPGEQGDTQPHPQQEHQAQQQPPQKEWESSWSSVGSAADADDDDDQFEPLPLHAGMSIELLEPTVTSKRPDKHTSSRENEGVNMFWTRNTSHKLLIDDEPLPLDLEEEDDDLDDDLEDNFEPLPLHEGPKLAEHDPHTYHDHYDDDSSYHYNNNDNTYHDNNPQQQYREDANHTTDPPTQEEGGHYNVAWTRTRYNRHTNHPPPTHRTFADTYTISNNGIPLGEGGFGIVYSCERHKTTRATTKKRKKRAVKIVAAENYNRDEMETLQLLRDCPYVVTLKDIFYGFDRVYLVMEEMKGDLLTQLNDKVYYEEEEARTVVHTLVTALQFLHTRGVAHRDIKPENILLAHNPRDPDDCTSIKLADFGLAKRFRDDQGRRVEHPNMFTLCGSPWYAAPEVFGRHPHSHHTIPYDERCDIWSVGIIMYLLIAGYMPFMEATSDFEVVQEVNRGKFKFHDHYWGKISPAAKQLISSLLKVHPVQRCTLQEALEGPWMAPLSTSATTSTTQVMMANDDTSCTGSRNSRSGQVMLV